MRHLSFKVMSYDGPERRRGSTQPEEQFQQDVEGLTRRVLLEKVSLHEIRAVGESAEGEKLIHAVQQRIIQLFIKIKHSQRALGDTSLVPAIRKRIMRLYNLQDAQLGTPGEMVAVVPPKNGVSADASPAGQRISQQYLERELFFFGKLYLALSGPDLFEAAKQAILNKFIMQCEDGQQQERIVKIIENLNKADLTYLGTCKGFSVIQIDSEILDQLNIASLLTEDDLYIAKEHPNIL